jgi:hypothetical protein
MMSLVSTLFSLLDVSQAFTITAMSYINCLPSACSQLPTLTRIMPLSELFCMALLDIGILSFIALLDLMISLRLHKSLGQFLVFGYVSLVF